MSKKPPFKERVKKKPFSERLHRRTWKKAWTHENWRSSLRNKLNAKIFVQKYGVCVPKTYGIITTDIDEFPPDLPQSWVMKPLRGFSGKGTIICVDGIDIIRNVEADKEHVKSVINKWESSAQGKHGYGFLFEEYVCDDHQIPTNFKVYTFADEIAMILVKVPKEKIDVWKGTSAYYLPDWTRVDFDINVAPSNINMLIDIPKPTGIEELIQNTKTLGKAYGTFCRVDFFIINGQPVFNEFCWYPHAGKFFTPQGEQWLGKMWENTIGPDTI